MTIRVEFHNLPDNIDRVMWLQQVPSVGEQVYVSATSREASQPERVAHVVWDLTDVTDPSAYINAVRADVYLEVE